jgi:predicted Zn-dependent protease
MTAMTSLRCSARGIATPFLVLLTASSVAAFSLISVEQEVAVGRQAQQEVRSQVPELRDADVSAYVSRIGRRLAGHAPGPRYPYSFSVADDRTANAFALPGGPIWVHRGILELAENEAQVAAVLAHEVAHVGERHAAEQLSKAVVANGLLGLLGAVLDGGGRGEAAARIGAGVGAQFLFLKFSRDHERDADRVGAQIMQEAGWDAAGMVEFFEVLQRQQRRSPGSVEQFLSSHPSPGSRAQLLRASDAPGGRRTSPAFSEMKRDLTQLPPPRR